VFGRKAGGLTGYVATFDVELKLHCLALLSSQCRAIRSHLSLYTVLKLSITIEVEMKLVISNRSQIKVSLLGRNRDFFA